MHYFLVLIVYVVFIWKRYLALASHLEDLFENLVGIVVKDIIIAYNLNTLINKWQIIYWFLKLWSYISCYWLVMALTWDLWSKLRHDYGKWVGKSVRYKAWEDPKHIPLVKRKHVKLQERRAPKPPKCNPTLCVWKF